MKEMIQKALNEGLIQFMKLTPESIIIGGKETHIVNLENIEYTNLIKPDVTSLLDETIVLNELLQNNSVNISFNAECEVYVIDENGHTRTFLIASKGNGTLSKPNNSYHFEIKSISFQRK